MKIAASNRSTERTRNARPSVKKDGYRIVGNEATRPRSSSLHARKATTRFTRQSGNVAKTSSRYSDRIAVSDAHSRMSKAFAGSVALATALVIAFGPDLASNGNIAVDAASASELAVVSVLEIETDQPATSAYEGDYADCDDFSWVTAETFDNMDSVEERVELIGAIARDDYRKTNVLASITAAQMMLESGCHSGNTSGLAAHYNNYFGIKGNPDDSTTWRQSTWTGETVCLGTQEQAESGTVYSTDAHFRVYDSLADSVADHSSYLALATWDGENEIYPGLEEIKDPREAAELIAEHYATGQDYADSLMNLIETYDLTRFDVLD